MNLLRENKYEGFPRPWLLSRICARRAATGDRALPWRELTQEYAWIFARLDSRATKALSPYFTLFELKRLLTGLRLSRGGDASRVETLLSGSLLREPLQKLLIREADFGQQMHQIVVEISLATLPMTSLETLLEQQHWSKLEETLFEAGLRQSLEDSSNRDVQDFFCDLIDIRNLLALQKALRWRERTAPPILEGGNITAKRLRQAFAKGDITSIAGLTGKEEHYSEGGHLEEELLRRLERRLRRRARLQGGIALLLHYLWNLYLQTRTREISRFMTPHREAS